MTKVPLLDLERQYAPIKDRVLAAIKDVFDSKQFIQGPFVEAFEEKVAQYCKVKHAIAVSSGTDALLVALMALNIGPGDDVITSPFTFFATGGSIARVGATPVFVDIDPKTFNINPALIEKAITSKTRAIMPVHLFGQTADMAAISDIARRHKLAVVEDAAQAIGATTCQGDLSCFSFFPSKNLGACGDAGLVATNNDSLAEKVKMLRVHGAKERYFHDVIGGNFRMDSIQAAILSVKLESLEDQHRRRQENAAYYDRHLKGVVTPFVTPGNRMIYNQYTIRSSERDKLRKRLEQAGVGCAVYYPIPLHLQKCFGYLGYSGGSLPESEKAAAEVLSLPIFAELTKQEMERVVAACA